MRGPSTRLVLPAVLTALGACVVAGYGQPKVGSIDVLPQHFHLRPGETLRYMPRARTGDGQLRFIDHYALETSNSHVLEVRDRRGLVQARSRGRAAFIVRSGGREQRYEIEVDGDALPVMTAVPYGDVDTIVGDEMLFVGHANRDGFDHTAVAKPGIDRVVREFKRRGRRVVYWVSEEFPDWYTDDRQPDLAIISEGQEHGIFVNADRVVFTGGDFMLCLLRNVQMTLHRMILAGTRDELHFIFPAEAIWTADVWGPGPPRRYPAPAVLLSSVWDNRASDGARYDALVVPFLDTLFTNYPVLGYPPDAPSPELRVLAQAWNVEVRVGELERTYRKAGSSKTIRMEFVRRYKVQAPAS
jgi:hypothetical protein